MMRRMTMQKKWLFPLLKDLLGIATRFEKQCKAEFVLEHNNIYNLTKLVSANYSNVLQRKLNSFQPILLTAKKRIKNYD